MASIHQASRPPGPGACAVLLAGCGGAQSTLLPAGRAAEEIARIAWWSTVGAAVIWLGVLALGVYAVRFRNQSLGEGSANRLIIWGGAVFPTVVLSIYLVWGLSFLPGILEPAPPGSLRIVVSGEQWWWRIRYEPPDGAPVEVANELHLPVGEPVEFLLESPDVIHSFWIPSLGGKIDMIPGRTNRLTLRPTRTGVFGGVCAEFCGASHALMMFDVVVEERDAYESWLAQQAAPAREPDDPLAARGRAVFFASGCGACHTVRGTSADGRVGPDLTHVGGRRRLAAGALPNDVEGFVLFLSRTDHVKPEVRMPSFGMIGGDDLRALATFLEGLE